MWQAIYYNNSMFTQPFDGAAVFGTAAGPVYPDTPLKPFRDPSGAFYTSNSARDIHSFDYTYPELAAAAGSGSVVSSKAQVAAAITRRVNALYDPGSLSSMDAVKTSFAASRRPKKRRVLRTRQSPGVSAIANGGLARVDYTIELSVDRAELPSLLQMPCSVEFYLGDDGRARRVGAVALLDMPTTGTAYGSVPLRRTLLSLLSASVATSASVAARDEATREEAGRGAGAPPGALKLALELDGGSKSDVVEALKESLRVVIRAVSFSSSSHALCHCVFTC